MADKGSQNHTLASPLIAGNVRSAQVASLLMPCSFHFDSELLPPLLQDFVRRIGLQPTMALVGRVGGLRIFIPTPERCEIDHPYAAIIGFDNLKKLAKVYGGVPHFQLPKADRALKAVRNAQICAEYQSTKTARQLAAEHRITEGQIVRILAASGAKAPTHRTQLELL